MIVDAPTPDLAEARVMFEAAEFAEQAAARVYRTARPSRSLAARLDLATARAELARCREVLERAKAQP